MRSTRSGSPGSCGRSTSSGSACADASAPPSPTCSGGTSPPPSPDANSWATSRISRSRAGISSISRRCWTASAARSSAGPSPATCARTWSPTRSGWPPAPAAHWTARSFTPLTEPSTDPGPTPASATSSGSPGRWARSAPAPTTPPAKSFHASLKRETLQGAHDYGDATACRRTVFAWLTRYNTHRRHSTNSYLGPDEYERRHHAAKLTLAA